jgi:hypothetical protein
MASLSPWFQIAASDARDACRASLHAFIEMRGGAPINATPMPSVLRRAAQSAHRSAQSVVNQRAKSGWRKLATHASRTGEYLALDQMIEIGRNEPMAVQPNPYPGTPDVR